MVAENNLLHVLSDQLSDQARKDLKLARGLMPCDVRGVLYRMARTLGWERWARSGMPQRN